MKSLNHDTCHLSRHDCDVKKIADDKDADAFMLLYFLTAKQHKKRTIWVRRWSLDRKAICWSYISSADCLWKLNHALEVGQLYRSSDVRFSKITDLATFYQECVLVCMCPWIALLQMTLRPLTMRFVAGSVCLMNCCALYGVDIQVCMQIRF